MHDKAEYLERSGRKKEAKKYWKLCEKLIEWHFRLIA